MLLFADDIIAEMKVVMEKWGMSMHWGKTKVMVVSRSGEGCRISVDGKEVEEVDKLKYLGLMICGDGGCNDEIEQRIGATAPVVGAMGKRYWREENCRRKLKCNSLML